ncbi:MAG TPA: DUF1674 domain-containing protein [Steroidobacteraceae bacterium]|nr:DUF1674 domain-containing protein [Steroidobacteraceae bacterium]
MATPADMGGMEQIKPSQQPKPPTKAEDATKPKKPKEIGGPSGPEPTRYGDWEVKGRCIDF